MSVFVPHTATYRQPDDHVSHPIGMAARYRQNVVGNFKFKLR